MSLGRLAVLVAIAAAVVWPLRAFVGEPIVIASPSMEPTLRVDAHVLLDKLTFDFRDPARGDVIVFHSPVEADRDLVKRVIALPGDVVELKEKRVFLNGQELLEPFIQHTREGEALVGDSLGPLTVPAAAYFVLGDNRDESKDSSVWTDPNTGERIYFVHRRNIVGLVRGFY